MVDKPQGNRAFVIMQIGRKESPERRRADQVFKFIITPVLEEHEIEPYRADLDPTPGQITPQIIKILIESPFVIADLTGRNPNVYYELGVAHSFDRPCILLCDNVESLAFDTKDERTIPLGDPTDTLSAEQADGAKALLAKALERAMSPNYRPSTVVSDAAASRTLDQLAPENPELRAIRDGIDELRTLISRRQLIGPNMGTRADISALTSMIELLTTENRLDISQLDSLKNKQTSSEFDNWVDRLRSSLSVPDDPWANDSTN